MMEPADTAEPNAKTLAELSALADGSLDPERAEAVREQISASPELSRRYERERRAVLALQATRSDRAPAGLRIRLDARRRPASRPRARLVYGGALAAAAAAVAAVVLLLPGGTPGSPSVSQAAALADRGANMPAPSLEGSKLYQSVQEIYFPNWAGSFGWRAAGQRIDRLGGRQAVTVYYTRERRRIAYTILAAPALQRPAAPMHLLRGVVLQTFRSGDRLVVTWRRTGHTCVLSGQGVSAAELSRLAAWKAPAATA